MLDWTEITGLAIAGAGFALAITAFVIGFIRHREAMAKQDDNARAEDHRHQEAMKAQAENHQQAMTALQALIRNTAPRPGPAE